MNVFSIWYSDFAFGYYYVVTSTVENVQNTKHKTPNSIMQTTIYFTYHTFYDILFSKEKIICLVLF